jgi:hypothetical protein
MGPGVEREAPALGRFDHSAEYSRHRQLIIKALGARAHIA